MNRRRSETSISSFSEQALLHGIEKFHVVGVVVRFGEEVGALVVHAALQRIAAASAWLLVK